ncbi:hypothetical protein EXIGUO8H_20328 [Exiguobacterium sp. 8H]|uniref:phage tail protein n=1 Tax=unclassified Exiguobacterium TaxID=2644629 RepID=UPI0012F21815|nr:MULTISPECIES: phage tail protein [unclassified Exiguobacterium]VXB51203.1 hypothetical protein EXIGUO8A_11396 [Exiguobacterium sp. 8A]VXB52172.1 hypothetical protein EXIGUO8H_20328 [Exiguobacterium sp. 8H]
MDRLVTLRTLDGQEFLLNSFQTFEHEVDFDLDVIYFEILETDIDVEGITHLRAQNLIEFEGIEYVIISVTDASIGERYRRRIVAHRRFYADIYKDWVLETISGTFDILTLMSFIFQGTDYRVEVQGDFDTITTENFGNQRRSALFSSALQRFGAEFQLEERRTGNWVVLKNIIGDDGAKQYRYKYNLKSTRREENTEALFTYIKGFGKPIEDEDGNVVGYEVTDEYISPLVAERGYPLIEHEPYFNDNITQPETLRRKLVEKLNASQPELIIEVDAVDIADDETVSLGDRVFVIYETMPDFDYYTRVSSIRRSYDYRRMIFRTQVTLANIRREITDTISTLSIQEQSVSTVVDPDGNIKLPPSINGSSTAINEAKKQLVFDDGIRGVNGSQVVRFERNGITTSQNGGASFTPAVTGAGLNLANSYGSLAQARVVNLESDLTDINNGLTTLTDDLNSLDGRVVTLEGYLPSGRGDTLSRPILGPTDDGFFYFDRDLLKMIVWNGVAWTNMDGTTL